MEKVTLDLIKNIKQELTSESSSVANILRKGKILAQYLKLNELKIWIKNELNGYDDKSTLPNYRIIRATNLGTFSGPFQSMVKNLVLPTCHLPDSIRNYAEFIKFNQGIGALESLVDSDENSLRRIWSQEAILISRDSFQILEDMILVEAHSPISKYMIFGIIDNVKNKLLDFIIDLEDAMKVNSSLKLKDLSLEEKESLFNVNIYGNNNTINTGNNNTTNTSQIQKGDFDSLKKYLSLNGISEDDISELQNIIDESPAMGKEKVSTHFSEWIGKMCTKAASGIIKVGVSTLPALIMKGLTLYYGW